MDEQNRPAEGGDLERPEGEIEPSRQPEQPRRMEPPEAPRPQEIPYNPPPPGYGQGYQPPQPPQGGQMGGPPGYPQGQPPPPGYPPQGAPPQGYPPPGYPPPQGYAPQGQPPPPGYPQGAPPPGYPPQGYPQGYPPPPGSQGYPPQGYAAAPPQRKGMPGWGWLLIGGGVLLVACVVFFVISTFMAFSFLGSQVNSTFSRIGAGLVQGLAPAGTATEFYDNMQSRDYESAFALLSPSLASQYTPEQLQAQWEDLEDSAGDISSHFPSDFGDSTGGTAQVNYTLFFENETYDIDLTLEQAGDQWLITEASPGLIPEP